MDWYAQLQNKNHQTLTFKYIILLLCQLIICDIILNIFIYCFHRVPMDSEQFHMIHNIAVKVFHAVPTIVIQYVLHPSKSDPQMYKFSSPHFTLW